MGGVLSRIGVSARILWRSDRGPESVDPDVELQQHQFETAVIEATASGNVEMLKYLHQQECLLFWGGGIDSISAKPPLLHRAAAKGHKAVVQYLLHLGLDVDETYSSGMTVLHIVCKAGKNSCLPPLMAKSRDIDRRDVWGRTPLIKALVYRNVEAAKMLLAKGANPNATDSYGMTPLTTAIDYDMMEMLCLLVDHGADVNLITLHIHGKFSSPPLYLAINNQNLPIIQQLLRLGAATRPRTNDYSHNNSNNNNNNNSGGGGNNTPTQQQRHWNHPTILVTNNNNDTNNSLQHSDAVSLCMYEILRHGAEHADDDDILSKSSLGIRILLEVLSAHGYPLGPAPDVLIRVLLNSSKSHNDYSMLLYKLQVCTASASEDILLRMSLSQQSQAELREDQQEGRGGGGGGGGGSRRRREEENNRMNQLLKQPPRAISSLQNQSRRVVRRALMESGGHNVLWACGPLQCPPALKTLLLLRDVDRAFGGCGSLHHRRTAVKSVSVS